MEALKQLLLGRTWRGSAIRISILLIIGLIPFSYDYKFVYTTGKSMQPTLDDGELCILQKSHSFHHGWVPSRYDIVLVLDVSDKRKHEYITKRVVGLPGETVQLNDNKIYIDGHEMTDIYGDGGIIMPGQSKLVHIPTDCIWIIGDNRQTTFYGVVKLKNVVGKIVWY